MSYWRRWFVVGKRSDFTRRKNDLYRTWDVRALPPLLPFLSRNTRFVEPCAGDGVLVDQLVAAGHDCVFASDISPGRSDIVQADVFEEVWSNLDCFITNPMWTRALLHPLIIHLSDQAPTWLLFDANWAFSQQARIFSRRCRKIVAGARVKWIENSEWDAKDDLAWYLFTEPSDSPTQFYFRP